MLLRLLLLLLPGLLLLLWLPGLLLLLLLLLPVLWCWHMDGWALAGSGSTPRTLLLPSLLLLRLPMLWGCRLAELVVYWISTCP